MEMILILIENIDVDGGKLVENDAGEMSMSEDSKSRRPGKSTTESFSVLSLSWTKTTCPMNHQ